jgi:hypothetical protein
VIAVGATDFNQQRAPYSNRGGALDVVAPGGNTSQDANSDGQPDGVLQESFVMTGPIKDFGYYYFQGTSMATPHVSGAAALLKSLLPGLDGDAVSDILTATALDLGSPGFDTSYGHGFIQVADAIAYATVAPTWGQGAHLEVARFGETELELTWGGAIDNVAVTSYRIRLFGTSGFVVAEEQATLTGLAPGQQYVLEVLARDAAGNWSEPLTLVTRTARAFIDTAGHTFYQDILWMSGMDITRGCNPSANDRFCPDDSVSRAQMAAFLVRALGLDENTHSGFLDVVPGSTFAEDVGRLATANITRGCNPPSNDRFCPDDSVTRGQMAAFLKRGVS